MRFGCLPTGLCAWLLGCSGEGARLVDATLVGLDAALEPRAELAVVAREDVVAAVDAGDAPRGDVVRHDASDDLVALDAPLAPGPVTLGTGQNAWEEIPREGARVELVMGPQGGWHLYGRVRLRGIAPDVYLTFSLIPEAGGAPVNLANETVRRVERRGLILVGDTYESSAGELVILADGVRPPDVVGRRFRFAVRVERPDPERTRVLVGGDERLVTVIDERP